MKKNIIFGLMIAAVAMVMTGCVGARMPVTGTMPGIIYTNTSAGVQVNVPVRPLVEKYKVIRQHAVGKVTATNIMGLFAFDDSSFAKAFDEILRENPEADDVIDIKVDVKKESTLMILNKTTLIVHGTAIKYLNEKK